MSDPGTASDSERIDRLEAGQQTLSDKLDQLLVVVSKRPGPVGGDPPAGPGGRPGSVEEQVQAELARAERERATKEAADAEKSDREQIKEQLAKLQEAAPVQPQPRAQRAMWGPR